MRRLITRVDPVLVQAVIAAALSFAHLHDIADAAGQSGWKAWAYPVSVDLLLVASWRRLRQGRAASAPVRLVWVWFLVALIASLGANVATAGLLDLHAVPAWLRILVAGWPAAAFLGGTLLAHAPAPAPTPSAERPVTAPLDAVTPPDVSVYRDDQPAPAALPDPEPVPALSPAPPTVQVPAALLDLARKLIADADRTGSPLTPDALRARLGVPAALADAIAAQLA